MSSKAMTKADFKRFINKYYFQKYTEIESNGRHAFFKNYPTNSSVCGYVYLWVEEDISNVRVVYVGKAGKTMQNRCDQHLGVFKGGSHVGKRHSDKIIEGLKTGKRYYVYARKSETATILDEINIPMCCVEEIALYLKLKRFQQLCNKTVPES